MALASSRSLRDDDCGGGDEAELQWAAIERLPTFKRIRTSLFDQKSINPDKDCGILGKKVIDVARLGAFERRVFIDQLITIIDKDNLKLLKRLKERMARQETKTKLVGLKLPTIEVRFENLNVEAECKVVHGKPQLPTLWNTVTNMFRAITKVNRSVSRPNKIKFLDDVSGIIKPSRMTLLLGLPGCGKTTFLQTLAGKHDPSLKVSGEISYNGCKFSEFVPQKTSAYVNQHDLHIPDMTVRETIDFSARCQGIDSRADVLKELSRREKLHGIIPEPDIDTYMKAISVEGLKRTLQTDYILKVLSPKEQAQFWFHRDRPYSYVSTDKFIAACEEFHAGQGLNEELCEPFDKTENHKNALSFNVYSLGKWELFKACFAREWSLTKRSSSLYLFRSALVLPSAFHPIPSSSGGNLDFPFDCRCNSNTTSRCNLLSIYLDGNVIVQWLHSTLTIDAFLDQMVLLDFPSLVYRYGKLGKRIPISKVSSSNVTLGHQVLRKHGLNFGENFYWRSVVALIGMWILVNVGFTLALGYLKSPGTRRPRVLSYMKRKEDLSESMQENQLPGVHVTAEVTSMVLPFVPVTLSFENVNYFVDTPKIILMKGGQTVYSGELGQNSCKLIEYFEDLFNIMGSVYVFMVSTGASNLFSVIPIVSSQRTIVYRERFAGMYSIKAHSLAQVIVEIPYVFLEAALFLILSYPAVNLYASAHKVSWYLYDTFCTLLTFKYMGMAIVSLSTTYQMAAINGSYCIAITNLFSGFLIPQPVMPKWWVWFYWMVPTSWTLRGLLTSQYGDTNEEIIAFGERKTIRAFLESYYGFKQKDLPLTAILLFAHPIFFASVFIYCTAKLNFQRR
ncbi:hypothetical protein V6N13_061051 [Hibiscus sabdariffa]